MRREADEAGAERERGRQVERSEEAGEERHRRERHQSQAVGQDLAARGRLAPGDREHRDAGALVVVLDQQGQRPEVGRRPEEDDRERIERVEGQGPPVAAAQPTSGGTAPAAPPMTMFWGVSGFSHSV